MRSYVLRGDPWEKIEVLLPGGDPGKTDLKTEIPTSVTFVHIFANYNKTNK